MFVYVEVVNGLTAMCESCSFSLSKLEDYVGFRDFVSLGNLKKNILRLDVGLLIFEASL